MFTGIVETIGTVVARRDTDAVVHFIIKSNISSELSIDQSVAHDGVCLTVVALEAGTHTVTAVAETLSKTNLNSWQKDKKVNIERAMKLGDRLDGHIVQGHVDGVGKCVKIIEQQANRLFRFEFDPLFAKLVIEKGSICINGVSLTAFNVSHHTFDVTIIPYTLAHTTFKEMQAGDSVNLEFDILGKYLLRYNEVEQA